ncbi:MAG: preprotein translocase subunit SecE [Eggerthellaceae bacterium]|jgi:preprotein translocase subunit SecE|nr:preprotein translocase subunit SecE [Eggerthellaceae bacterium]MDR2721791.1 preprotein translocase subunit SecE [Coriobacteriaceae bacterium]
MAKKSKTQKAKASAVRAQKKVELEVKVPGQVEATAKTEEDKKLSEKKAAKKADSKASVEASSKAPLEKKQEKKQEKTIAKTEEKKSIVNKNRRFGFLSDVRGEMRRVTWPTRQDVLRWSMVVVGALIFFGIFTLILDRAFAQLLPMISGLGA